MEPVSRFDPFSSGGPVYEEQALPTVEFALDAGALEIQY
jgi:hypothetical protein